MAGREKTTTEAPAASPAEDIEQLKAQIARQSELLRKAQGERDAAKAEAEAHKAKAAELEETVKRAADETARYRNLVADNRASVLKLPKGCAQLSQGTVVADILDPKHPQNRGRAYTQAGDVLLKLSELKSRDAVAKLVADVGRKVFVVTDEDFEMHAKDGMFELAL
jgi:septal ring factor EnvC (AmiA/AmiB activator)